MLAALLVLLAQGPRPDLAATVDRAHVAVGEVVTLQVRVRTRSAEPLVIALPPLAGFSVIASHEITEVSLSGTGGPIRITTRDLALRADRPGVLVIGAISAVQGRVSARSAPIVVTVDSAAAGAAAIGGIARGLLDAAPAPRSTDQVTLTLVATADTLLAGQQLDVLAAAWFPRELGNQLRHAPVLVLPTPVGVWGYPPDGPSGVATSRLVHGHWMDLYVAHQALFPLAPGRLTLAPASLSYAVPVSASILNREERYTLASESLAVAVLPLPAAGRPAGDQGVVAQSVRIEVGVDSIAARVGEPLHVTADVSGTGNVALWPEPALHWPVGFRAYPGETETRVAPAAGRIAGVKRFTYLVVPDSAGSFILPEALFPYYDPVAGAYAEARGASRPIVVAPGLAPQAVRAVLVLEAEGNEPLSGLLARGLAPWGWLAILLLPPLAVLARRSRERPRPAPRADASAPPLTRLGQVEREFLALLSAYVADAHARDGDGLASALRAAGLESAVADHVVRLRDRLRSARYGPLGVGDQTELAAEVTQVLRALGAEPGAGRRRRVSIGVALALCLATSARAQAPGAEVLYGAGALRAAADSFVARATATPHDPAAWYDLGATLYRAGADGKAVAAWTRAARLAPRDPLIRRARGMIPLADPASEDLLAVGWATPGEWALAAGLGWMILWGAMLSRRRPITVGVWAVLTLAAGATGAREWRRQARPVAVVVAPAAPIRAAPYGSASAGTTLETGAAVEVMARYGRWIEIRRDDGVRGWVLDTEVVRL